MAGTKLASASCMKTQLKIAAVLLGLTACNTSGKEGAPHDELSERRQGRAKVHAAMRAPNPDKPEHKGMHGGPGLIVGWLQATSAERVAALRPEQC